MPFDESEINIMLVLLTIGQSYRPISPIPQTELADYVNRQGKPCCEPGIYGEIYRPKYAVALGSNAG